jgi:adenosylcobinamide-GDP ribazoletransferase
MGKIAQELRAIWTAVMFFTRLPLPEIPALCSDDLRRSSTYFPLIGWLIGGTAAGVWWMSARVFPPNIASGLSVTATILLTGAMHEDGLADVCDGFGGGSTKEKILTIMQDSRVGAFGLIGVILVLGLKWQTVAALPAQLIPSVLIAGHILSRAASITLMTSLDYVREGPSKARALTSRLCGMRFFLTIALGISALLLLPPRFWWVTFPIVAIRFVSAAWFKTRIGGYTGDCLGAVQQISELVFLLTVGAITWA